MERAFAPLLRLINLPWTYDFLRFVLIKEDASFTFAWGISSSASGFSFLVLVCYIGGKISRRQEGV